jgi:alkanesulfonate monooxygenase SsuD/methylene tetrahydromethanopterin reductase-like flavin-dependent oxidoreductase (luciferase family)
LRMAGEVADGVHVHPLGEPGYLARHVMPNVAEGAAKSRRSPADIAVIVPVMTIVGDSDEERHNERELVRASIELLWEHAELRVHLGRGRVRRDDREHP